jgi:hypothetical protein
MEPEMCAVAMARCPGYGAAAVVQIAGGAGACAAVWLGRKDAFGRDDQEEAWF